MKQLFVLIAEKFLTFLTFFHRLRIHQKLLWTSIVLLPISVWISITISAIFLSLGSAGSYLFLYVVGSITGVCYGFKIVSDETLVNFSNSQQEISRFTRFIANLKLKSICSSTFLPKLLTSFRRNKPSINTNTAEIIGQNCCDNFSVEEGKDAAEVNENDNNGELATDGTLYKEISDYIFFIIRDFISSWYDLYISKHEDFPVCVIDQLNEAAIACIFRIKTVDQRIIVQQCLSEYQRHLIIFKKAVKSLKRISRKGMKGYEEHLVQSYETFSVLHSAVECKKSEVEYLRSCLGLLMTSLLSKELVVCKPQSHLIREIVSQTVLWNIFDLISDPGFINEAITLIISDIDKADISKKGSDNSTSMKLISDMPSSSQGKAVSIDAIQLNTTSFDYSGVESHNNQTGELFSDREKANQFLNTKIKIKLPDNTVPSFSVSKDGETVSTKDLEPSKYVSIVGDMNEPNNPSRTAKHLSVLDGATRSFNSNKNCEAALLSEKGRTTNVLTTDTATNGSSGKVNSLSSSPLLNSPTNSSSDLSESDDESKPYQVAAKRRKSLPMAMVFPNFTHIKTDINRKEVNLAEDSDNQSALKDKLHETEELTSEENTVQSDSTENNSTCNNSSYQICNLSVTGTEQMKEYHGSKMYVLYVIEFEVQVPGTVGDLCNPSVQLVVKRRYREFGNLQWKLEQNYSLRGSLKRIKHAPRRLVLPINRNNAGEVETRRKSLESYLKNLLECKPLHVSKELADFLALHGDAHIAFVKDAPNYGPRLDKIFTKGLKGVKKGLKSLAPPIPPKKTDTSTEPSSPKRSKLDKLPNLLLKKKAKQPPLDFEELQRVYIVREQKSSFQYLLQLFQNQKNETHPANEDPSTIIRQLSPNEDNLKFNLGSRQAGDGCDADNVAGSDREERVDTGVLQVVPALLSLIGELMGDDKHWFYEENLQKLIVKYGGLQGERMIMDAIHDLFTEDQWALYLSLLKDVIWPDGELLASFSSENLSIEEKQRLYDRAIDSIFSVFPDYVKTVIGSEQLKMWLNEFLGGLQNKQLNKHLLCTFIDLFLDQALPELKDGVHQKELLNQF